MKHVYMLGMILVSIHAVIFCAQPRTLPLPTLASPQKVTAVTEEIVKKAVIPLDQQLQQLQDMFDAVKAGSGKEIANVIGNGVARAKVRNINQEFVVGELELINAAARAGNVSLFRQLLQALAKILQLSKDALQTINQAINDFARYVSQKDRGPKKSMELYQPAEREMQLMQPEESGQEPLIEEEANTYFFDGPMEEEPEWDLKIDSDMRDLYKELDKKNLISASASVLEDINAAAEDLPPQKINYVSQLLKQITQAVKAGNSTVFKQAFENLRSFLKLSKNKISSLIDAFTTAVQRKSKASIPVLPGREPELMPLGETAKERARREKEQAKAEEKVRRQRAQEIEESRKQEEQRQEAQRRSAERGIFGEL